MAGGSPVINLVNGLIQRAVRDGANDIHIESGRSRSFVRFRIDGVLYEVLSTRADLGLRLFLGLRSWQIWILRNAGYRKMAACR